MRRALEAGASALAISTGSPAIAYELEARSPIVGRILKFNGTGRESVYSYKRTEDNAVVKLPRPTKLVANLDELKRGVVIWGTKNGQKKPICQILGNALDPAWRDPPRDRLGNHDRALWPLNGKGQPEDPVKYSWWMYLKEPGSDILYTFVTNTVGGAVALTNLVHRYRRLRTNNPKNTAACHPVIRLDEGMMASKDYGENPASQVLVHRRVGVKEDVCRCNGQGCRSR
jgi:hypothetical protein